VNSRVVTLTSRYKVLTYIEYRAVSELLTPHHLSTQRVCPPPAPKAGGDTLHSPGGEGVGGHYISEDVRHWIGLLQYNPYTVPAVELMQYLVFVKNLTYPNKP
jgi:hypothetical protein